MSLRPSVSRYADIPKLTVKGVLLNDRAICGKAVATTVPPKFSMKNAPATMSATTADCLADDD